MRRVFPILALLSCVRATPPPPGPPPPEPVHVPEGCLASLAGPWRYAGDEAWQYEADDDGGTVVLHVTRTARPDAGFTPRKFRKGPEKVVLDPADAARALLSDAGAAEPPGVDAGEVVHADIRVELTRSPQGFAGFTLAPLVHPSGRSCEARFETKVLSCADGGLVLQAAAATALGEECQRPPNPRPPEPLIHTLIRPAPAPDAG